jgi:hypothetical protein
MSRQTDTNQYCILQCKQKTDLTTGRDIVSRIDHSNESGRPALVLKHTKKTDDESR